MSFRSADSIVLVHRHGFVAKLLAVTAFVSVGSIALDSEAGGSACGCACGVNCGGNCCCAKRLSLPASAASSRSTQSERRSQATKLAPEGTYQFAIKTCPWNCPATPACVAPSTWQPAVLERADSVLAPSLTGFSIQSLSEYLEDPPPRQLLRPPRG